MKSSNPWASYRWAFAGLMGCGSRGETPPATVVRAGQPHYILAPELPARV